MKTIRMIVLCATIAAMAQAGIVRTGAKGIKTTPKTTVKVVGKIAKVVWRVVY